MSIKIKTHVLAKWNIAEFGIPMVFPTYDLSYKEMEKQYNELLAVYSWYSEDETGFYIDSAKISTEEGIEEWQIVECEMEINNLHEFTSAFEMLLGQYSLDFAEFIDNLPHTMAMATVLSDKLKELQILLNATMPDYDGSSGKRGIIDV